MCVEKAIFVTRMNKAAVLFIAMLTSLLVEARLPDLIPFRKGNLWGYSDSTKKIIIEPQFESVVFFEFERAIVGKKGKFGVIDRDGKFVLQMLYKQLHSVNVSGYWSGCLFGSKLGLVDSTGRFTIPALYHYVQWANGDYVSAQTDSTYVVYHKTGNRLFEIPTRGSATPPFYSTATSSFIVNYDLKWGVVDKYGNTLIERKFGSISYLDCNCFMCTTDSFVDYYKVNFKKVRRRALLKKCSLANQTRFVATYVPTSAIVYGKKQIGDFIIDDSSQVIKRWGWKVGGSDKWAMMPKYESTGYFFNGIATFGQDGKLGLVDSTFQEIVAPKYEVILPFRQGFVMITRKSHVDFAKDPDLRLFMGYVDIHGTEYWED